MAGLYPNPSQASSTVNASVREAIEKAKATGVSYENALALTDEAPQRAAVSAIYGLKPQTQALGLAPNVFADVPSLLERNVFADIANTKPTPKLAVGLAQPDPTIGGIAKAGLRGESASVFESILRAPATLQRMVVGTSNELIDKGLKSMGLDPAKFNPRVNTVIDDIAAESKRLADEFAKREKNITGHDAGFAALAKEGTQADQAVQQAMEGHFAPLGRVVTDPKAWAGFLAQGAPSLALAFATGGATKVLMALEGMQAANSAAEYERRTGIKLSDAQYAYAVAQVGVVNGLLEKAGLDQLLGGRGRNLAVTMLKNATAEGGTETLQNINSNAAAMGYDDAQELLSGSLQSAMGGAGLGAALAPVTHYLGAEEARKSPRVKLRLVDSKPAQHEATPVPPRQDDGLTDQILTDDERLAQFEQDMTAEGAKEAADGATEPTPTQTPSEPGSAATSEATTSLAAQLAEVERLHGQATSPALKEALRVEAERIKKKMAGKALSKKERAAERGRVNPQQDSLTTAIQKLGGIDTDIETDWAERLAERKDKTPGLPGFERPGKGRSLDDLAESLHELGYLQAADASELAEKLDRIEHGQSVHSIARSEADMAAEFEQSTAAARPGADFEARRQEAAGQDKEAFERDLAEHLAGSDSLGDLYDESAYGSSKNADERILYDVIEIARGIDADAMEAIVERAAQEGDDNRAIARRLINEVIHGRGEKAPTQPSGAAAAGAGKAAAANGREPEAKAPAEEVSPPDDASPYDGTWRREMEAIANRFDEIGRPLNATTVRKNIENPKGFPPETLLEVARDTLAKFDTETPAPAGVSASGESNEKLPPGTVKGGEKEIRDLVRFAEEGPANEKRAVSYARVGAEQSARLKSGTGLELEGFRHTADNFAIRHIFNQHGNAAKEARRGQEAVTQEDIARLPQVIDSPDSIEKGGVTPQGKPIIRYRKRFNGTTVIAEEVRTGRRELALLTMWKTRAAPDAPDAGPPAKTSATFDRNPPQGNANSSTQGAPGEKADHRQASQRGLYRRRIEEITEPEELRTYIEQLRTELLTDERTGLGSNKAWLNRDPKAFIAALDLDSLKWVNDHLGHPAGDRLIGAVGDALRAAGLGDDAFHVSGDEFYVQGDDEQALRSALEQARAHLKEMRIDGNGFTYAGAGFSYGIAPSIQQAEHRLANDKQSRQQAGQRAARGERPNGVVEPAAPKEPAPAAGDRQEATGTGQGERAERSEPELAPGVEPWQMSHEEWEAALSSIPAGTNKASAVANAQARQRLRYGVNEEAGARLEAAAKGEITLSAQEVEELTERLGTPVRHRDVIAKALREGKPVPEQVLAEYPDLAAAKSTPPKRDEFDEAFDAALDEQFGPSTTPAPKPPKPSKTPPAKPPEPSATPSDTERLANAFVEAFREGRRFGSIIEARKLAEKVLGRKIAPGSSEAKALEEAVEAGIVLRAREIVAEGMPAIETYDALVDLYRSQPILGERTSASIERQAYSTPAPLAYIASRLAGIDSTTKVYEPTAGNGMLLIEADPENITANEINAERAENLRLVLGDEATITQRDATQSDVDGEFDVIISNPPFGKVRIGDNNQMFDIGGVITAEVDHGIVWMALGHLRTDGRAVLIIASKKGDTAMRLKGYRSFKTMAFMRNLYDTYNVTDHFTVDGGLYQRQGAGWPVDVIVIEGRGKSTLDLPTRTPPPIYESWEALEEKINGRDRLDTAGELEGARHDTPAGATQKPAHPATIPIRSDGKNQRHGGEGGSAAGDGAVGGGEPGGKARPARQPRRGGRAAGGEQRVAPGAGGLPEGAGTGAAKAEPAGAGGVGGGEPGGVSGDALLPGDALPPGRGLGESAKGAATETLMGLDEVTKGLAELFGGHGKLGSGLSFDEDTYEKAKPFFLAGVRHFKAAGQEFADTVRALVRHLAQTANMGREAIAAMKPYIRRFVEDVRAGRINIDQPKPAPAKASLAQRENLEAETEHQVRYQPTSNARFAVGTLVPRNMQTAMQNALDALAARVGDIDQYVADKLGYTLDELLGTDERAGYFSAEQVDVIALAIDNVEAGAGFVLGDQTGVGKGRVVAAMLRYALHNNKTPVFVTKDPGLYADMVRDLRDIGLLDIHARLFVTNNDLRKSEAIPLSDDASDVLASLPKQKHKAAVARMAASGSLPEGFDVLFTTYSQMQYGPGGEEIDRQRALLALAPNALIVLDESHEAGGSETKKFNKKTGEEIPTRADFIRQALREAQGVVYSSATYAKNPTVMSLYFKTDLALAVERIEDLAETIRAGGVPLQQVAANMLVEAGQYARRERSFDGVEIRLDVLPTNAGEAKTTSDLLRAIFTLDADYMETVRDGFIEAMAGEGVGAGRDAAIGESSAGQTGFAQVMHNVISQMLLALKAGAVADKAIALARAGEKPIVALTNTNEGLIKEYLEDERLQVGDAAEITFNRILARYLYRLRRITLKDSAGNVNHIHLSDAQIIEFGGADALKIYKEAEAAIAKADLSGLPAAPIDYILDRLRAAGIASDEITGRGIVIENGIYKTRKASASNKKKAMNAYNAGRVDALVINQAGSTGFSMHATDQPGNDGKPRHMIILQPDPNIDVFMQMLGRIHRTGQVKLPGYTIAVSDLAIEKRLAAVLMRKLASLNANTTASKRSAVSLDNVTDFMNPYGDEVVADFLRENTEIRNLTNVRPGATIQGIAARLTGRLAIMDPAEVTWIYEQIEAAYKEHIEALDRLGMNALEAKTLDLAARTTSSRVLVQGRGGDSPFAEDALIETASVKKLGKPYTEAELAAEIKRVFDGKSAAEYVASQVGVLDAKMPQYIQGIEQSIARAQEAASLATTKKQHERAQAALKSWEAAAQDARYQLQNLQVRLSLYAPGTAHLLNIHQGENEHTVYAVSLGVDIKAVGKNPTAASAYKVRFAIADPGREIRVVLSKFFGENPVYSTVSVESHMNRSVLDAFNEGGQEARENREIVTGNLVSGFATFQRGQIVMFTDDQGTTRQGILMPREFNTARELEKLPVPFESAEQIQRFLEEDIGKRIVKTPDGIVNITRNEEGFQIAVSLRGGKPYFLNRSVREIIGDFQSRRGQSVMRATIGDAQTLAAVVEAYRENLDARFVATAHKEEARAIVGADKAAGKEPGAGYTAKSIDPDAVNEEETRYHVSETRRKNNRLSAGGAADTRQLDLFVQEGEKAKTAQLPPSVRPVTVGHFATGIERVTTPEQAAHVLAALRKHAQETLLALVTDKDGKPLAILRHTIGDTDSASVYFAPLIGSIHSVPGAANVWFAHNHPSGLADQSRADINLTYNLVNRLDGTGITPIGMIVVAPGGEASFYSGQPQDPSASRYVTPAHRPRGKGSVPVQERRIRRIAKPLGPAVTSPDDMLPLMAQQPEPNGVLLFDSRMRPLAFVPMDIAEMRVLRTGTTAAGASKLMRAVNENNAVAAAVKTTEEGAGNNVASFVRAHQLHTVDAIVNGESLAKKAGPDGLGENQVFFSLGGPPVARLSGDEIQPEEGQSLFEAAHEYYRDNFQNGPDAYREGVGNIRFSSKGWHKLKKGLKTDETRLRLIPAIRHIIEKGEYRGRFDLDRPRTDDIVAFHHFVASVELAGETIQVGVSVGEDAHGNLFYNLNRDPDALLEKRTAQRYPGLEARGNEPSPEDDASYSRSVDPGSDDFNLRILDRQATEALAAADLHSHISSITEPWKNAPQVVVVVQTEAELPSAIRGRIAKAQVEGQVRGVWHQGKAYIVAANTPTLALAEETLLHEVLGHYGLRGLLGAKLDGVLLDIYRSYRNHPRLAAIAKRYGFDLSTREGQLEAAEEMLAHMVQTGERIGLLRRVMARIRAFLKEHFPRLNLTWTDADIWALLERSRAFVTEGGVVSGEPQSAPRFSLGPSTIAGRSPSGEMTAVAKQYRGKWNLIVYKGAQGELIGAGKRRFILDTPAQVMTKLKEYGLLGDYAAPLVSTLKARPLFTDGFTVPSPTARDAIIYNLQDRFVDLKRLQDVISEGSVTLDDASNAHIKETLYHGRAEKRVRDFRERHIEPLLKKINALSLSLGEVNDYLQARHAEERNRVIHETNPAFEEGTGSGITDDDAIEYLAALSSEQKQALEKIAPDVDRIIAMHRRLLVASGLEKEETIRAWESDYKHYVPLRGFEEIEHDPDAGPSVVRSRGFDVRGRDKSALGRHSKAGNVLLNVFAQYESVVVRAEKNRVGQSLLRLLQHNLAQARKGGNEALAFEINPVVFKYKRDPKTGLVMRVRDLSYQAADNVLVVKVSGKDYHIRFTGVRGERLAKALKNLDQQSQSRVINVLGQVSRLYAKLLTSWNPEFIIPNFVRDVQTAVFNLSDTKIKGATGKLLKSIPLAMAGIAAAKLGKNTKWARHFEEFELAGGKTGWIDAHQNLDTVERQIRRYALELARSKADPRELSKKLARAVGGGLVAANEVVENATRLAAYVSARELGLSQDQAANLAKNLTVNFNRRGALGPLMNIAYTFSSASIQGTTRMLQALKTRRGWMYAGALIAAGAITTIIGHMLAAADGDDDEEDDAKDYLESRYWVHRLSDGGAVTIPIAYGWNVFKVIGDQLGHAITAKMIDGVEFEPTHALTEVAGAMVGAYNPLGGEITSWQQTIAPTMTKPIVQIMKNENWYGGQIYPTPNPFELAPSPDSQLKWDSTNPLAVAIAQTLNEVSFGSEVRPGLIDVSPAAIEHVVDYYTGGLGRFVTDSTQAIWKGMIQGEALESREVPIARRFYRSDSERVGLDGFYDNLRAIEYAAKEFEAARGKGDYRSARDISEEDGAALRLSGAAKRTREQVRELRNEIDRIEHSDMPRQRKEERTARVREQLRERVQRFNSAYQEAAR